MEESSVKGWFARKMFDYLRIHHNTVSNHTPSCVCLTRKLLGLGRTTVGLCQSNPKMRLEKGIQMIPNVSISILMSHFQPQSEIWITSTSVAHRIRYFNHSQPLSVLLWSFQTPDLPKLQAESGWVTRLPCSQTWPARTSSILIGDFSKTKHLWWIFQPMLDSPRVSSFWWTRCRLRLGHHGSWPQ